MQMLSRFGSTAGKTEFFERHHFESNRRDSSSKIKGFYNHRRSMSHSRTIGSYFIVFSLFHISS